MTLVFLLLALIVAQAPPAADDLIVWTESRRLTWDDFKAKPPSGQLIGAKSALGFGFAFGCRDNQLHIRVVARFHSQQSYVGYRIISSGLASRAGLQHEQIHFDLAEVYARKIRKVFRELKNPCPRSDAQLEALAEPLFREEAATQRRYDTETENGQHGIRQKKWEEDVARQLAELAAYVDTESRGGPALHLLRMLITSRPRASPAPSAS